MQIVSDTVVNGKRKLVVRYTEEEKIKMKQKIEELKKQRQQKQDTTQQN